MGQREPQATDAQVGICHRVLWLKAILNLDSGRKQMTVQPL